MAEPGWRLADKEGGDELIAAWLITPEPERIARLAWVAENFVVVLPWFDLPAYPAAQTATWTHKLFAVAGFCTARKVAVRWLKPELWPSIEGLHELLEGPSDG